MAVIGNKTLSPIKPTGPELPRRVVVKFRPEVRLPYARSAATDVGGQLAAPWAKLTEAFPGIRLAPYFTSLVEQVESAASLNMPPPADDATTNLRSYFA